MKSELWKEVEQIYHAALERAPHERESFLDKVCGGKEELRYEVAALLAYDDQASQFIESPAIEVLAKGLASEKISEALSASLSGQKVGAYQILSPLGKGGMSEVYLARDTRLGRKVALKVLSSELIDTPDRINRFEQEAHTLSSLNHPNIVTIYEICRESGTHFIVEEFVEGRTLRQIMLDAPLPKLDLTQTLDIAAQIVEALAVAHEAGITHRDIKPENVMVRPDGIVKVLDFGLAKSKEPNLIKVDSEAETLAKVTTNPGLVMGTPHYMSPEQARGQNVDARTDIFSFGIVVYEMIAGRPPFDGVNTLDTIGAILNQEPEPLTNLTPEIPDELVRLVFKCLNKDQGTRYQSARELANELQHLKKLITPQSISSQRNSNPPGSTRYRFMIAVATLLILISIISYAVIMQRSLGNRDPIKSLAVLPLKSISTEKDENYLGLGIADTIINKVSRINGLVVRPISAVRRYANQEIDALQAAREQRVDVVLDGTIQREGDRLRVTVNLLRTNDGVSLWADQFDLLFTELFGLQDKVARQVVERLHYRIGNAEQVSITKRFTTNLEAYDYYTKAMFYFADRGVLANQRNPSDRATELLRKAIELDPNYALAHAQLGYAYSYTAIWFEDNIALLERARKELEIAERLDPKLAEIYVARSNILWSQLEGYQFEKAILGLRQAQKLDPQAGHFELAELYAHIGLDGWQQEMERALEIDPTNEYVKDTYSMFYIINGLPDEALAIRKRIYNQGLGPLYFLTKKMPAEAAPSVEAFYRSQPSNEKALSFHALLLALQGRHAEAEAMIPVILKKIRVNPGYHHFTHIIARIYALEGKTDEAVNWMRVTAKEGYPNYPAFQRDPYLDSLRDNPGFMQFMKELKMRWEGYKSLIG